MRKKYDFSRAKLNPYAAKVKRRVTIRVLETSTIDYFKSLAKEFGIPYQNLINLYLRDCAVGAKRPSRRANGIPIHPGLRRTLNDLAVHLGVAPLPDE